VGDYRGHAAGSRVQQLLVIGDMLLTLGSDGRLLVWRIGQYDTPQVSIEFESGFNPTVMCHPDTYLNKVVVGGADGQLQLWNFVTGTLLHTFKGW